MVYDVLLRRFWWWHVLYLLLCGAGNCWKTFAELNDSENLLLWNADRRTIYEYRERKIEEGKKSIFLKVDVLGGVFFSVYREYTWKKRRKNEENRDKNLLYRLNIYKILWWDCIPWIKGSMETIARSWAKFNVRIKWPINRLNS